MNVDYEERMQKFADGYLMPVALPDKFIIEDPALKIWRGRLFKKTHYKAKKEQFKEPIPKDPITMRNNLVLIKPIERYGFYCPSKTFRIAELAPIYFTD